MTDPNYDSEAIEDVAGALRDAGFPVERVEEVTYDLKKAARVDHVLKLMARRGSSSLDDFSAHFRVPEHEEERRLKQAAAEASEQNMRMYCLEQAIALAGDNEGVLMSFDDVLTYAERVREYVVHGANLSQDLAARRVKKVGDQNETLGS